MAKTLIFCLTLILFINIYSSVTIDDADYDEDGVLIIKDMYIDSVEDDEEEDDDEDDHSMPDLSEFVSDGDEYPGPPKNP